MTSPTSSLGGLSVASVLGPQYDYSAEMNAPSEIGIVRDPRGSWTSISNAAAGVNYYGDVLGFGTSTGLAKGAGMSQHPMGLQFFTKTGGTCSNGAPMYEYVNTIPGGIRGRLGNEIEKTLHVNLKGLAPGIVDDAIQALNPAPMFNALIGSGYARCRQVTMPVGDANGALKSKDPSVTTPWIPDTPALSQIYGIPYEKRWVFDSWISAEEYNSTPKDVTESFCGGPRRGLAPPSPPTPIEAKRAATFLLAALVVGLAAFQFSRK
jgi:hypothetical protein